MSQYKVTEQKFSPLNINEAVKKIRNHTAVCVLKITFSRGSPYFFTLGKINPVNYTEQYRYCWRSIFHQGNLNIGEGKDEDKDLTFPSLHTAIEFMLTCPCSEQHEILLFTTRKEFLTYLIENN